MKKITSLMILTVFCTLFASAEIISIPGIGDVGIEVKGKSFTIAVPKLGTYGGEGYFKSAKDFDIKAIIPAGDFTDYIPVVGQVLSLAGLDTASIRVLPRGLGFGVTLTAGGLGALRGNVTEVLSKVKALKVIIDKIISGLDIREVVIEGLINGKNLSGLVRGEVAVIGKVLKFDAEGEISFKRLLSIIKDKIIDNTKDFVVENAKKAYNASKAAVVKVGKNGVAKVSKAWGKVKDFTREAIKTIRYATNSYDKNLKSDLPNFINAKADPMVREGNAVFAELYNEMLPEVRNLDEKEKAAVINEAINPVVSDLDSKWQEIYNDKSTDKWSTLSKREKELRKRYREGIQQKWDEHKAFRNQMVERLKQSQPLVRIPKTAQQSLEALRIYSITKAPVTICSKVEDLAWDLFGRQKDGTWPKGSNIGFWGLHGDVNQQWIFESAGKPNQYHIRSVANNKYIHISGAKDVMKASLVIYDGAGAEYRQTVFTAFADKDGMLRFKTDAGWTFDLEGGVLENGKDLRLWESNNSDAQAFYVTLAE